MRGESFFKVNDLLEHPSPRCLLSSGPVEHLLSLLVVREHALEFRVDVTVQLQQLAVCNLEDPLCVLLAEDFLDAFIQVAHADQVLLLNELAEVSLRQSVKQGNVLLQSIPKRDGVALRVN